MISLVNGATTVTTSIHVEGPVHLHRLLKGVAPTLGCRGFLGLRPVPRSSGEVVQDFVQQYVIHGVSGFGEKSDLGVKSTKSKRTFNHWFFNFLIPWCTQ